MLGERPAVHVDATAGVAGDMLLGALLDAGASLQAVRRAVHSLGIDGLTVDLEATRRAGLACSKAVVSTPGGHGPGRGLAELLAFVETAELAPQAARFAAEVFERLCDAEAAAHGIAPDRVHFHEVGAADALADVLGTAAALHELGLLGEHAGATCSAVAAGSGTTTTAHGVIPLPAPVVLQIAARHGLALTGTNLPGERSTPTGTALLATLATPGAAPTMTVRAVGSGAGSRDTPELPNITRVVVGTAGVPDAADTQALELVEATVDDLDPRLWPSVLEALRGAGAWDAWTSPITGRHGRPGQVVTALCGPELRPAVVDTLFRHTSTLGVRWSSWQRAALHRRLVQVPIGPADEHRVGVKVAHDASGVRSAQPEIADAERAAAALGLPVREVCERALAAYRRRAAAG